MRAYRLATAMTIAAMLAGCGGGGQDAASGSAPPTVPTTDSAATSEAAPAAAPEPSPAAPAGLVIDMSIAGGQVDPTNARFDGTVGEPITLRVSSDVDDSLHVHSVPDQTFVVAAAPDQSFEFVVEVPGRVEIELHDLNRTVAIVDVRA